MENEGFLRYLILVDSDDRRAALSSMCRTFAIAERMAGTHEALIQFAPRDLSANKYILDCQNDIKPKLYLVTPEYGLPTHLEGYRWDSPYEKNTEGQFEKLCSTGVIRDSTNKIMGTFSFSITSFEYKTQNTFMLNLPLVYV